MTIVFTSDATTPEEACRALRPAVADVASRVQDLSWDEVCAVQGDLDGESSVRMVSARREDLSGFRWTESLPTPESQVVSFVEFTAGLE